MKKRETYHDYVIKDGKFVGRFDEMYAKFEDPWHQSKQPNPFSRNAGILFIKKIKPKKILECGGGLGYYADCIYKETGIIPKSIDISETAIKKARKKFKHLDFEVYDLKKGLAPFKDYDCILFAEIMWYILDFLDTLLLDLKKHFKGKYLIINQVFYKGTQKYGNEYFTNLKELMDYMPFQCIGWCEATLEDDTTIETSSIYKIKL